MAQPFAPLSFDDALAETATSGGWLVVSASGEHCAPCKVMDRTTWRDPKVADWVSQHGVAVQFVIEREEALAARLEVRAVPSVIVFHGREEVDRRRGLCSAGDLVAWLDGLLQGRTALDGLLALVKANPSDMSLRLRLAGAMLETGRLEEATEEYAWLWKNMVQVEPAMVGVRGSFLISQIFDLVTRHDGARRRFEATRDELQSSPSFQEDPVDWVLLNQALGDEERTLSWVDSIKDAPALRRVLGRAAVHVERLLIANERWADFGRLYPEAAEEFERRGKMLLVPPPIVQDPDAEMREAMLASLQQHVRTMAGQFMKGLHAAGRDDEARRVFTIATSLDPGPEMRSAVERERPPEP